MARTFNVPFGGTIDKNTIVPKQIVSIQMLDGSGSMGEYNFGNPTKWANSLKGVQNNINQARDLGFKSISTVVFSSGFRSEGEEKWDKNPKDFVFNPVFPKGGTPLYQSMEVYLQKALLEYKDQQVLFSIFTDGQDTEGFSHKDKLMNYINQFIQKGWTITFVGLKKDQAQTLKVFPMLDESNFLGIEDDGKSFEKAFKTYATNTAMYAKSVEQGMDVTTGFFKSIQN